MDIEALFAGLMNGEESFEIAEPESDPGTECWLPAVFESEEGRKRVVDPTGGGNGFLGGLAVALARGRGLEEAAVWGCVSASFAIEQVGMPVLGKDGEGRETWNGERVEERLDALMKKLGK